MHIHRMFCATVVCLFIGHAHAEVWKSVDVATYPVGINVATGKARNHIVALEIVGPPRNIQAADQALRKYAQDSVEMAFASAIAAFNGTPGDIGAKATAAFGQFKATIIYRASINTAFRHIARFEIRTAEREIDSDKLVIAFRGQTHLIAAQAGAILKRAFPRYRHQIQHCKGRMFISPAYNVRISNSL